MYSWLFSTILEVLRASARRQQQTCFVLLYALLISCFYNRPMKVGGYLKMERQVLISLRVYYTFLKI